MTIILLALSIILANATLIMQTMAIRCRRDEIKDFHQSGTRSAVGNRRSGKDE